MRKEKYFLVPEHVVATYSIEYDLQRLQQSGCDTIEEYIEQKYAGNPWGAVKNGDVVISIRPVAKQTFGPNLQELEWQE